MLKFHNHYQRMKKYGCAAPMVKRMHVNEDGSVEFSNRPSNDALPPAELYDLETNLKAKVNLDAVPTKIVDSGILTDAVINELNSIKNESEIKPAETTEITEPTQTSIKEA